MHACIVCVSITEMYCVCMQHECMYDVGVYSCIYMHVCIHTKGHLCIMFVRLDDQPYAMCVAMLSKGHGCHYSRGGKFEVLRAGQSITLHGSNLNQILPRPSKKALCSILTLAIDQIGCDRLNVLRLLK